MAVRKPVPGFSVSGFSCFYTVMSLKLSQKMRLVSIHTFIIIVTFLSLKVETHVLESVQTPREVEPGGKF